jgi:hypothetical protein
MPCAFTKLSSACRSCLLLRKRTTNTTTAVAATVQPTMIPAMAPADRPRELAEPTELGELVEAGKSGGQVTETSTESAVEPTLGVALVAVHPLEGCMSSTLGAVPETAEYAAAVIVTSLGIADCDRSTTSDAVGCRIKWGVVMGSLRKEAGLSVKKVSVR